MACNWNELSGVGGGGGVLSLYGLYGDVPLDRVWFLTPWPKHKAVL